MACHTVAVYKGTLTILEMYCVNPIKATCKIPRGYAVIIDGCIKEGDKLFDVNYKKFIEVDEGRVLHSVDSY